MPAQSRSTKYDIDQEFQMHHVLSATLAGSREQELRTVARRPDHLMSRVLELERDASPDRRATRGLRRSLRRTRS